MIRIFKSIKREEELSRGKEKGDLMKLRMGLP